MPVVALVRWLLLALVRQPEGWLVGALCWTAGFLLPRISPLGAASHSWTPQEALEWVSRWCFPAGLLGSALAIGLTQSKCAFLELVAAADRWLAEIAFFALSASAAAGLLVLGAACGSGGLGHPAGLLPGIALQALHLAAFGSILCNLRLSPATCVLAQILSASSATVLSAEAGRSPWFAVLDVASHPMLWTIPDQPTIAFLASIAPVTAVLLASWLVRRAFLGRAADASS